MIELLNSYYTKEGKKVVVLDYSNGRYLCSYEDGSKTYLYKEEILVGKERKKTLEPVYSETENFLVDDKFMKENKQNIVGTTETATTINFDGTIGDVMFDLNLEPDESARIEKKRSVEIEKDERITVKEFIDIAKNKDYSKEPKLDDLYEDL